MLTTRSKRMLTMFTKISSEYLLLKKREFLQVYEQTKVCEKIMSYYKVYEQFHKICEKIRSYYKMYEQVSYYQSDNHELQ